MRPWQWLRTSQNQKVSHLYLRFRLMKDRMTRPPLQMETMGHYVTMVEEWADSLPKDVDAVIGIPRSGLLTANIVALKLDKPLTTPDLFISGQLWRSRNQAQGAVRTALLVDDSIGTGKTMEKIHAELSAQCPGVRFIPASPIVGFDTKAVSLYHDTFSPLFEWNLIHYKLGKVGTDLDGVLCHDPAPYVDQDDDKYRAWMLEAKPRFIPKYELEYIITNRIEKFRPETEDWLSRNGVRYKDLIMWDVPSNAHRHDFPGNKVRHLLRLKPDLYIESNWSEARTIYRRTSIMTVCTENMTVLPRRRRA